MNNIKVFILKVIGYTLIFCKRGTSYVGYLDEQYKLNTLKNFSLEKSTTVVYVIGTNGKSTITNSVYEIYKNSNVKVLSNIGGANIMSGIKTLIIMNMKKNTLDCDVLVVEVDEKTIKNIVDIIPPNEIIITNFFRDQLDRYFEIDIVLEEIVSSVEKLDVKVYYNSEDPLIHSYFRNINSTVYKIEMENKKTKADTISELKYCPDCSNQLSYTYYHYSHIGDFICNVCGFKAPIADFTFEYVDGMMIEKNKMQTYFIKEDLPKYFYFNISLILTYMQDKVDTLKIEEHFKNMIIPSGRYDKYRKNDSNINLSLSKNVAGMEQIIDYIYDNEKKIDLIIGFSDNYADGRDVSWIWDVEFEKILKKVNNVYIFGTRSEEMKLRLEYANYNKIFIYKKLSSILEEKLNTDVYAISNYTPLKEFLEELNKNKK